MPKTSRRTMFTRRKRTNPERAQPRLSTNPRIFPIAPNYIGFNYNPSIEYSDVICLGRMDNVCSHCNALRWKNECEVLCCVKGKVCLSELRCPPSPLRELLTENTPIAVQFRRNIRSYNNAFAMTSFGVGDGQSSNTAIQLRGNPTFRVQGQIYHRIGSFLPVEGRRPSFIQVYFYGSEGLSISNTNTTVLSQLRHMLNRENTYLKAFICASERADIVNCSIVIRADTKPPNEHQGIYNVPTVSEVAILYRGEENAQSRDIVIESRNDGRLTRISEIHQSYDALQYPLIFWDGSNSYSPYIPLNSRSGGRNYVSCADYYAYRLMVRLSNNNFLLRYGYLLNQYLTDMAAKIESGRLNYIRFHQKELRAEDYNIILDDIRGNRQADEIGQAIILPPNYQGSPRHMHQYRQDAMTYVRKYGNADLFFTVTCDKNWIEITRELMPGQEPLERHDIISRVFSLKVKHLYDDLSKNNIYGPINAIMYTVEWQKRGLPHIHLLLWLRNKLNPDHIDFIIKAEIPDPSEDPILFELVTRCMLHGPCGVDNPGAKCMKNGKCTKQFPKKYCSTTTLASNSYPMYRRLSPNEGGHVFTKTIRGRSFTYDNRWVIPYSPVLLRMYKSHINAEVCCSIRAIKYLTKYITKGSDRAICRIGSENRVDEISSFVDGRYLCSNEAAWRILKQKIHRRWPPVQILNIHLENGQRIYYNPNNLDAALPRAKRTHLTAFFELCEQDEFARTLLYSDVPEFYTWVANSKTWKRRVRGQTTCENQDIHSSDTIGRLVGVHPSRAECFYLRMLLTHVRGPVSFENIRTVNGVVCSSFREACLRLNLIHNNDTWHLAMREAACITMPAQLRRFFAILLCSCEIPDPGSLWDTYKDELSMDYLRRENATPNDSHNSALNKLGLLLRRINGTLLSNYGLPTPTNIDNTNMRNPLIDREVDFDVDDLRMSVEDKITSLTEEQAYIFNRITCIVQQGESGIFFLSAAGGTGKTYLVNLIIDSIRSTGKIVLATASTGIASTLLHNGRTSHSMLKLPLRPEQRMCSVSRSSMNGELLRRTSLIVMDEATMIRGTMIEALNRTLKDVRNNQNIMGGVPVLMCGDFRQTLPIVRYGGEADMVNECVKRSELWSEVEIFTLTKNLRVHASEEDNTFDDWLIDVGNGAIESVNFDDSMIQRVTNSEELITSVFGLQFPANMDYNFIMGKAILAPRNDIVREYNSLILKRLPGNPIEILSADTVVTDDDSVNYPIELLNQQTPSHLAPHRLEIKIGAPVMVLRNLNPPRVVNGTRFIITNATQNLLSGIILNGRFKGEEIHIPKIHMYSQDDLPIEFRRTQFPVCLCFAITINKSQGQTFDKVGLDLSKPCFSHGQLYVALSRVRSRANLSVLCMESTSNVVYKEILD